MEREIEKYWSLILYKVKGIDNDADNNYYIDFENGRCIDESDIKRWIHEYSDLSSDIDEIEEKLKDYEITVEEATNELVDYLKKHNIKNNDYSFFEWNYQHNFTEEEYVLYKAQEIANDED